MFEVEVTLAAAAQFSAATPIVTFEERSPLNGTPLPYGPEMAPVILGYSYSALGDAHTATLVLARAAGAAANLQIPLEDTGVALNSFSFLCGVGGGIVVPRRIGFEATAQPPVAADLVQGGEPWVVLFSTVGKTGNATFKLRYAIVNVGGG